LINTPQVTQDKLSSIDKSNNFFVLYPPLGLMYLSSSVKKYTKGVKTKILDLHLESVKRSQENIEIDWFEMCDEAIKSFQPDLCGFSIMFETCFKNAQSIGETIRKKYPELIIVSGGVHVTGIAKENGAELDYNDLYALTNRKIILST